MKSRYTRAVPTPNLIVAGAGLAGLATARALCHKGANVTLVAPGPAGRRSPFVPGILSGWISAGRVHVPLTTVAPGARLRFGRVERFDPNRRKVFVQGPDVRSGCESADLFYDALVLAVGNPPSPGDVAGVLQHALVTRAPSDMLRVRNQIAQAFEAANAEDSARRRRALLTIAVVGEDLFACHIALELQALAVQAVAHHPRVASDEPRVLLISRRPIGPPALDEGLARVVARQMASSGVEVRIHAVAMVDADHMILADADGRTERLDARTVVWTRRDELHPLLQGSGDAVHVDETGRLGDMPGVFVVGDAAGWINDPLEAAMAVASNALAHVQGRALRPVVNAPRRSAVLGSSFGVLRVAGTLVQGRLGGWLARRRIDAIAPRPALPPLVQLDPEPTQIHLTAPPPVVRSRLL